jgi:hypothetical protein
MIQIAQTPPEANLKGVNQGSNSRKQSAKYLN